MMRQAERVKAAEANLQATQPVTASTRRPIPPPYKPTAAAIQAAASPNRARLKIRVEDLHHAKGNWIGKRTDKAERVFSLSDCLEQGLERFVWDGK
jgi:hypothetical protein